MSKTFAPSVGHTLTTWTTILHHHDGVFLVFVKAHRQNSPCVEHISSLGSDRQELLVGQSRRLPCRSHRIVVEYYPIFRPLPIACCLVQGIAVRGMERLVAVDILFPILGEGQCVCAFACCELGGSCFAQVVGIRLTCQWCRRSQVVECLCLLVKAV